MKRAQVSILMATFNGGKYLTEQLESIISQTYDNWTLYISDDSSTDNTVSIIDSYVEKYPEIIHRLPSNNNHNGAKGNFLNLLSSVKDNYYMFADQDDVWNKDKIELSMNRLLELEHGESAIPCLIFTDLVPTDENVNPIANSLSEYQNLQVLDSSLYSLVFRNVVTGCTMAFNDALKQKALFSTDWSKVLMHDYWLALVASIFGRIQFINSKTVLYRQHINNVVGARNTQSVSYISKRVFHVKEAKNKIRGKKSQALFLLSTYQEDLDQDKRLFLLKMSQPRSGISFYLKNKNHIHGFFEMMAFIILG